MLTRPDDRLRPILTCLVVLAITSGCARPIVGVELQAMSFMSPLPPITGSVEVCINKKLRSRHWNVDKHPYRVELGKRAAINFERMVKAAFRDVIVDYSDACGRLSARPWFEARIISANRDWDGVEGIVDPEPVDTALTMLFRLYANDGVLVWSKEIEAEHRAPGFVATPVIRSQKGSRDFGVVLADALQQGYEALLADRDVRAYFADDSLARVGATGGNITAP